MCLQYLLYSFSLFGMLCIFWDSKYGGAWIRQGLSKQNSRSRVSIDLVNHGRQNLTGNLEALPQAA